MRLCTCFLSLHFVPYSNSNSDPFPFNMVFVLRRFQISIQPKFHFNFKIKTKNFHRIGFEKHRIEFTASNRTALHCIESHCLRTMMETHELVVPRSIPITSPTSSDLNRRAIPSIAATDMPGDAAFLAVSAAALRRNSVDESILLRCL